MAGELAPMRAAEAEGEVRRPSVFTEDGGGAPARKGTAMRSALDMTRGAEAQQAAGGGREAANEKLHFGDQVYFRLTGEAGADDDGAFLLSEGFSDLRVGMQLGTDDPADFRYALWRIVPRMSYEASKTLVKLQRRDSMQAAELLEYQEAVEVEEQKNIERAETSKSGAAIKQALFGDVVQLQHVHSGKYLTQVPRAIAEKEKENMKLMLTEGGSEGSWFRFSPRWAMRSDGDPIFVGDQTTLACVKLAGARVRGGQQALDRDPLQRREVNATNGDTNLTWSLHRFAETGSEGDGILHFGESVRLHHSEGRCYICGSCNRRRSDKLPYLDVAANESEADRRRAKTVFRVESVTRAQGGEVLHGNAKSYAVGRAVRFRHVATGRYLSVDYNDSLMEACAAAGTGGSKTLQPIAGTRGKLYQTKRAGRLFGLRLLDDTLLSDERRHRSTHFCLVPVVLNADVQDERVRLDNFSMRVLHHTIDHRGLPPQLWLHDAGVEKETKEDSTNALERSGMINRRACFAEKQLDQDSIMFKPVEHEEVTELAQIAGTIDVLELYCSEVLAKKGHAVRQAEAQQVLHALAEIIFAALQTTDKDPARALECDGIPAVRRQQQMREMKVIDELFWTLTYIVDKEGGRGYITTSQLAGDPQNAVALNVHRHVYKAIQAAFLDNRQNENYIATHTFEAWRGKSLGLVRARKYMDEVVAQLGAGTGAAGCLTKLLANNRGLLEEKVTPETVQIFLDLIRTKGPTDRFMAFLKSTASCEGEKVTTNQELLLKMCMSATDNPAWLQNRRELMCETMLDKTSKPRPWHSKSDDDKRALEGVTGPIDHGDYLAKNIGERGTHDIMIGWSCSPGWTEGSDTLFYTPADLGLVKSDKYGPVTKDEDMLPPGPELARYFKRCGTAVRRYWVRLEHVVWTLKPELLCEVVVGKSWEHYEKELLKDPVQEKRFNDMRKLALYYHANIELFAELALGRNSNCINALEEQFSYELLISGMVNARLPPRIRQGFSDLCTRLWVDRFPHDPMKAPAIARIYSEVEELHIHSTTALPQFRLKAGNPCLNSDDEFIRWPDANKFHLLEDFISDYIDELGGRTIMEHRNENYLTVSLLKCAQFLAKFGFYNSTEQIADLVDPLVSLLDGRADKMSQEEADAHDAHTQSRIERGSVHADVARPQAGRSHRVFSQAARAPVSPARKASGDGVKFTSFEDEDESKESGGRSLQREMSSSDSALGLQKKETPLRWQFNEDTMLAHRSKVEMLNVISSLSDVRLDFRLSQILAFLKESIANGRDGDPGFYDEADGGNEPFEADVRAIMNRGKRAASRGSQVRLMFASPVADSEDENSTSTTDGERGLVVTKTGQARFESMFGKDYSELDMDQISESPLVSICFDLLMYESGDVFEAAFRTLTRHFSQRTALIDTLAEVQLLTTPATERAYKLLERELDFMRNSIDSYETWGVKNEFSDVDMNVVDLMKSTLDKLTELCGTREEPNRENQDLLRALRVSDIIARAQTIPLTQDELASRSGHLFAIKKSCNKFMQRFVCDNKKNQMRAYRYVNVFLSQMGKGLGVAPVITGIFHNNTTLCRKVTRELLNSFVSTIRNKGPAKGIQFLAFVDGVLDTLISVGGQTLKDKQLLMLKLFSETANESAFLLYTEGVQEQILNASQSFDPGASQAAFEQDLEVEYRQMEGYLRRVGAMRSFDYSFAWHTEQARTSLLKRQPDDGSNAEECTQAIIYHSHMIDLLSKACAGKAATTEVKAQQLLPLPMVLSVIMDDRTVLPVRSSFVKFLDEAYFETEIDAFEHIGADQGVWEVINKLVGDMESVIQQGPTVVPACLTLESMNKGQMPTQEQAKGAFMTEYIFGAVCPALGNFVANFFEDGIDSASSDVIRADYKRMITVVKGLVASGVANTAKQLSTAVHLQVALGVHTEMAGETFQLVGDDPSRGLDLQSTKMLDVLDGPGKPDEHLKRYTQALKKSKAIAEAVEVEFLGFVDAFVNVEKLTDPADAT
eukprot:g4933.t1